MTVQELVDILQDCDQEREVVFENSDGRLIGILEVKNPLQGDSAGPFTVLLPSQQA